MADRINFPVRFGERHIVFVRWWDTHRRKVLTRAADCPGRAGALGALA